MAEIVWSEPALADLDAIADYIALDNRSAAENLIRKVFNHVDQLQSHPESGPCLPEFKEHRYRQIIEPPCRIIYRHKKKQQIVYIVHVIRVEQKPGQRKLHGKP